MPIFSSAASTSPRLCNDDGAYSLPQTAHRQFTAQAATRKLRRIPIYSDATGRRHKILGCVVCEPCLAQLAAWPHNALHNAHEEHFYSVAHAYTRIKISLSSHVRAGGAPHGVTAISTPLLLSRVHLSYSTAVPMPHDQVCHWRSTGNAPQFPLCAAA